MATTNKDENISFLCPNGHKLTGPAKLQGRPGKCPHCNARFEIPLMDQNTEEIVFPDTGEAIESIELPVINTDDSSIGTSIPADAISETKSISGDFPQVIQPTDANSAAALFAELWFEKQSGATIQLYLQDGEAYIPQWYSPTLSQGTYGTFAAKSSDGYITITAIAWESIIQMIVEKIEILPEGFE